MYSISTRLYYDELKNKLDRMSAGVLAGDWTYGTYEIKYAPTDAEVNIAVEVIATTIADIVQREKLHRFSVKYLRARKDMSADDKKHVHDIFLKTNYLQSEDGASCISYYLLYVPILDYLKHEKFVDIDGWINFRTAKYDIILEDMLEQTIYDYNMQADYIRVLDFLKDVRNAQNNSAEQLNLYCSPTGKVGIYNRNFENVTAEYVKRYCEDIDFSDITTEDFIIHILIKVCPESIVIHNTKDYINPNFIITLQEIFDEQLHICGGCELCKLDELP
ncbi:MAG: hypothetical protein ATN34_04125 [Epulopiscium sp. Nele67-Bin002]|nr:MAG: hypothetical protein ATN34_04125 [Epulopiscium sp. Nele67-Bin002]OON93302.1 MAG: hypothetical protein ATN33_05945 [Epulopiscium sp. Nele67-Bin001]